MQKKDWLKAAFIVMARQGIEAVRVEVLAREMGLSKGSFYWHFQNRTELLAELLQHWETETEQLIAHASQMATPLERLQALFAAIGALEGVDKVLPDSAIFFWSRQDAQVAERVKQVENLRLAFLGKTLHEFGFELEEAHWRAELVYLAFLGYQERASREPQLTQQFPEFSRRLVQQLLNLDVQNKQEESKNE